VNVLLVVIVVVLPLKWPVLGRSQTSRPSGST
jgi:hypothetical protein